MTDLPRILASPALPSTKPCGLRQVIALLESHFPHLYNNNRSSNSKPPYRYAIVIIWVLLGHTIYVHNLRTGDSIFLWSCPHTEVGHRSSVLRKGLAIISLKAVVTPSKAPYLPPQCEGQNSGAHRSKANALVQGFTSGVEVGHRWWSLGTNPNSALRGLFWWYRGW